MLVKQEVMFYSLFFSYFICNKTRHLAKNYPKKFKKVVVNDTLSHRPSDHTSKMEWVHKQVSLRVVVDGKANPRPSNKTIEQKTVLIGSSLLVVLCFDFRVPLEDPMVPNGD